MTEPIHRVSETPGGIVYEGSDSVQASIHYSLFKKDNSIPAGHSIKWTINGHTRAKWTKPKPEI